MRIITCPKPTAIGTIPATGCKADFGQTLKIGFQRTGNSITDAATAILEATWTALKAGTGDTKVVFTPILSGVVTEPGKVKEYGSGNDVPWGIPIPISSDPTKVTVKLIQYSPEQIRALKDLQGEDLVIYLINEVGWIGAIEKADDTIVGIPIRSLNIGDRKLGGLEAPDEHEMTFSLPANWSDYFTIIDPTANFSGLDL